MKTVITLEVTHTKPIEGLADAIAARAYTLDRVEDVVVITDAQPKQADGEHQQERAAFEAWALSEAGGWWEAAIARVGDGYHAGAVTKQWIGWQARACLETDREDAARLDWLLPVIGGDDSPEADSRTLALGQAIMRGKSGREAIDAACKAKS